VVRTLALCGCVAAVLPASASLADPCRPEARSGEVVTIARMLPDHRIELADGRAVRLAGLDLATLSLPPMEAQEAILLPLSESDRHGDLRADLFVDGMSLAEEAAGSGHGRVRPAPEEGACYATLLDAEHAARERGLGLWSEPGYAVADASDPAAVARQEGRFAIVSGKVRHVGTSGNRIWIDFGPVWREDVTLVVPMKERSRFIAAGLDLESLTGHRIRARGVVELRSGPRIDISEPAAIESVAE
jgi:hypothetical protein